MLAWGKGEEELEINVDVSYKLNKWKGLKWKGLKWKDSLTNWNQIRVWKIWI